jgi:predicted nucleic acid-binding protein
MSVVVSDTSPINYLIRVEKIDLLQQLFGEVLIPPAVLQELKHPGAPLAVREWALSIPPWARVLAPAVVDPALDLGPGETEAIALAKEIGDTLLLIDERKGRRAAVANGLRTAGTLNILEEAAARGLLDFEQTIARLRATNFRVRNSVLAESISRVRARKDRS